MKKIALLLAILGVFTLSAQKEITVTENIKGDQDVYLDFKFAQDINIENGKSKEIIIKASVTIDDGAGNESFSIKTDRSSGRLKLYSDFADYFKNRWDDKKRRNYNSNTQIDYTVMVPEGVNLIVKSISGSIYIDTFKGDLITDLISGDVTIKNYKGEMRLKTISGALDVVVNKADLSAKSVTGTIYSDIDFNTEADDKPYNRSGNKVEKIINGGMKPLAMETISGNIYIRKG